VTEKIEQSKGGVDSRYILVNKDENGWMHACGTMVINDHVYTSISEKTKYMELDSASFQ